MVYDVIVESVGMSVPENEVTNEQLVEKYLPKDLITPERIEKSTGISKRRFVTENDTLVTMALHAIYEASNQSKEEVIDGIFYVGNVIPDQFEFESGQLKLSDAPKVNILDVVPEFIPLSHKLMSSIRFLSSKKYVYHGGCAHYLTALGDAYKKIRDGELRSAIVVTATDISRHLDWSDRNTAILFADGACAAILKKGSPGPKIIDFYEAENTSLDSLLYYEKIDNKWVTRMPNGEAVYETIINAVGDCIANVKTKGYCVEDIDHFILHQANRKTNRTALKMQDIPYEKAHMTIDKYGNTSSASIGITWSDALQQRKIKERNLVMIVGFGAGFRWNYILVQY